VTRKAGGQAGIELRGNLAATLTAAQNAKKDRRKQATFACR
jgi:hypothetical protein